jgi:hypothetical protein
VQVALLTFRQKCDIALSGLIRKSFVYLLRIP